MKGIIWCTEIELGKKQLKDIIYNYVDYGKIELNRIQQSRNKTFAEFKNGDIWEVALASESARGKRCNISYIQEGIPQILIDTVIRPSTIARPFNGFYYYYP